MTKINAEELISFLDDYILRVIKDDEDGILSLPAGEALGVVRVWIERTIAAKKVKAADKILYVDTDEMQDLYSGLTDKTMEASKHASLMIKWKKASMCEKIWAYINHHGPRTANEIERELQMNIRTVGARISEMAAAGYLAETGDQRQTRKDSNTVATVYKATKPTATAVDRKLSEGM